MQGRSHLTHSGSGAGGGRQSKSGRVSSDSRAYSSSLGARGARRASPRGMEHRNTAGRARPRARESHGSECAPEPPRRGAVPTHTLPQQVGARPIRATPARPSLTERRCRKHTLRKQNRRTFSNSLLPPYVTFGLIYPPTELFEDWCNVGQFISWARTCVSDHDAAIRRRLLPNQDGGAMVPLAQYCRGRGRSSGPREARE